MKIIIDGALDCAIREIAGCGYCAYSILLFDLSLDRRAPALAVFCVCGAESGDSMAKSRAGRKRKVGERYPCGDLKVARDYGCDGVIRRRATYAKLKSPDNDNCKFDDSYTADAVGRAWSSDLLDRNPDRAREMMDGARKIAAQYWRVYGFGTPDSLARFQPSGSVGVADPIRDKIREDALNLALEAVGKKGRDVRKAFDELVVDMHPDFGPSWLDRIIMSRRGGPSADRADFDKLNLALTGLREVA